MAIRIAISRDYGGFNITEEAFELYKERSGSLLEYDWEISRDDPILIEVIEEMAKKGLKYTRGHIKIVDIPDGVVWYIQNYDGIETIMEHARKWY